MKTLATATVPEILAELSHRRDEIKRSSFNYGTVTYIIEQAVMECFDITYDLLHLRLKIAEITLPRQVTMTLMREHGLTWQAIGNHFNLDHGTAIYASNKIAKRESSDPTFSELLHTLRTQIANTLKKA